MSHGQPLLGFETMAKLFYHLETHRLFTKYWSYNSGWTLFEHMFVEMKVEIVKQLNLVNL